MASCSSTGFPSTELYLNVIPYVKFCYFADQQGTKIRKLQVCQDKGRTGPHKVGDGQHVCSANAKSALLLLPHSLNGSMVQGLTIHRIRISAWHIYAIQRMDYNYYKYSKHIYILIQAPYNTDIYKISMKMKPVRQIMYSVDVTVFFSLWVNPNWYSRRRGGW